MQRGSDEQSRFGNYYGAALVIGFLLFFLWNVRLIPLESLLVLLLLTIPPIFAKYRKGKAEILDPTGEGVDYTNWGNARFSRQEELVFIPVKLFVALFVAGAILFLVISHYVHL